MVVARVCDFKVFRVFLANNKVTKYAVVKRYFSWEDYKWHAETVAKYADLKSCLSYISAQVD